MWIQKEGFSIVDAGKMKTSNPLCCGERLKTENLEMGSRVLYLVACLGTNLGHLYVAELLKLNHVSHMS
jgi:hypothetical protein